MRGLLNSDVAPVTGIVLLKPGKELMHMFGRGQRVLICPEPEYMRGLPSGRIVDGDQPLLDDPALAPFFASREVLGAAGGINNMESVVARRNACDFQSGSGYHTDRLTYRRTEHGAVCFCTHHDTKFLDHVLSAEMEAKGARNAAEWIIDVARRDLKMPEGHLLTLPELCWWASRKKVVDQLPPPIARQATGLPPVAVPVGPQKSSDIYPEADEKVIIHEVAKQVLALKVDPESPESFMLRPKRKRWVNEQYTRWVKQQKCVCCGQQADDPHHIIGHGLGGMGTKAHDLFVIPLCRKHHDELHADMRQFEEKYGSQVELLFRFLDTAIAVGVIGTGKK